MAQKNLASREKAAWDEKRHLNVPCRETLADQKKKKEKKAEPRLPNERNVIETVLFGVTGYKKKE